MPVFYGNLRGFIFSSLGDRGAFLFVYSGGVFSMTIEGEMAFASAYSGDVFSMTIEREMVFASAYSGNVFSMTIEGGVLPDGTQRIGRGEVGAQLPLRLPSLPSETSHPPLSSRLCGCLGAHQ